MTLKQLLAKNKAIELAAALKAATVQNDACQDIKPIEETPHVGEIELNIDEGKKDEKIEFMEEEIMEEQPKPKKRSGKKPANREYMVVEDIENVSAEPEAIEE